MMKNVRQKITNDKMLRPEQRAREKVTSSIQKARKRAKGPVMRGLTSERKGIAFVVVARGLLRIGEVVLMDARSDAGVVMADGRGYEVVEADVGHKA